ncbi:MAG: DUF370 domain-containing protein [Clostridia bacterium]|nr:DUF370 domain-containing protein [Clostridia bacterium]
MYLHVGNGKSLKKKHIVGIFDLDTATVSKHTKSYIDKVSREGKISYEDYDLPRSFIVMVDDEGEERVSLSRISTIGLRQRAETPLVENND